MQSLLGGRHCQPIDSLEPAVVTIHRMHSAQANMESAKSLVGLEELSGGLDLFSHPSFGAFLLSRVLLWTTTFRTA